MLAAINGQLADVVLWQPAFSGIKPELVVKGGFIVWSTMGDSAASLMTCEPLIMRLQWGAFGQAKKALSACFVNQQALHHGIAGRGGEEQPMLETRSEVPLSLPLGLDIDWS